MFYVYFLESIKNQKHYTGFTDDLKRRLIEHNAEMGGNFTSKNGPWKVIYYEAYPNKKDAQEAEK
ncbi:GIY-YIG nuclease family protein, partial [Patescibacteria group bacterium]|nr:GIY-YIG nuclease family protein [Patescibacteria group bacterium]